MGSIKSPKDIESGEDSSANGLHAFSASEEKSLRSKSVFERSDTGILESDIDDAIVDTTHHSSMEVSKPEEDEEEEECSMDVVMRVDSDVNAHTTMDGEGDVDMHISSAMRVEQNTGICEMSASVAEPVPCASVSEASAKEALSGVRRTVSFDERVVAHTCLRLRTNADDWHSEDSRLIEDPPDTGRCGKRPPTPYYPKGKVQRRSATTMPLGDELDTQLKATRGRDQIKLFSPHSGKDSTVDRRVKRKDSPSAQRSVEETLSELKTPAKLHYMSVRDDECTPADRRALHYAITPGPLDGGSLVTATIAAPFALKPTAAAKCKTHNPFVAQRSVDSQSSLECSQVLEDVFKSMDAVMQATHGIGQTLSRATENCPVDDFLGYSQRQMQPPAKDIRTQPIKEIGLAAQMEMKSVTSRIEASASDSSETETGFYFGHRIPEFEASMMEAPNESELFRVLKECNAVMRKHKGVADEEATDSRSVADLTTLRIQTPPESAEPPDESHH